MARMSSAPSRRGSTRGDPKAARRLQQQQAVRVGSGSLESLSAGPSVAEEAAAADRPRMHLQREARRSPRLARRSPHSSSRGRTQTRPPFRSAPVTLGRGTSSPPRERFRPQLTRRLPHRRPWWRPHLLSLIAHRPRGPTDARIVDRRRRLILCGCRISRCVVLSQRRDGGCTQTGHPEGRIPGDDLTGRGSPLGSGPMVSQMRASWMTTTRRTKSGPRLWARSDGSDL